MKQIFLTLIFCLALQFAAFGQVENSPCPKITVNGEGVIYADSGKPMLFTASIEPTPKTQIEYLWTVTTGKIIKGQGTHTIEVEVENLTNVNLTATVEIKGLPENCPNAFSETSVVSRIVDNCLERYKNKSRIEEIFYLDQVIINLSKWTK